MRFQLTLRVRNHQDGIAKALSRHRGRRGHGLVRMMSQTQSHDRPGSGDGHGQPYAYSVVSRERRDARALNEARQSSRCGGVADGMVDLVPFRKRFDGPMRVEVWPEEPPSDGQLGPRGRSTTT
jgi:hypothetical protein